MAIGHGHLRKETRGRNYRQIRQCHGRSHSSHFGRSPARGSQSRRRASLICPTGKSLNCLSSPLCKNISLPTAPKSVHCARRLVPKRGGSRSSRTRGGMRWTLMARLTNGAERGRRSRVVLTPRRWRQVGGSNSAGDGDKKARSPGRARRKPLKPLRGECRVIPV